MSSPLTEQAKLYTWRQLAQRAGIVGVAGSSMNGFERLGISVHYGSIDYAQIEKPALIVLPCADEDWNALLVREPCTLDWIDASEILPHADTRLFGDCQVPVLFWGKDSGSGNKPFVDRYADNAIVFNVDIVAGTFFMLSRWEETVVSDRDEHGRFPAAASVAYKQGFLDRPIVDEYALVLREWLKVLLPQWEPERRTFSVKLSHDIDNISRFRNPYTAMRTFGGDLLKRRNPRRAWSTARDALAQVVAPAQTDYVRGIHSLADLSRGHSLDNDAFYFMANGLGPFGCGYNPTSSVVKKCIEDLREKGFEIGFHPSYNTFQNPAQLAEEKAHMDAVLGETNYGGRQHFLRFQVPDTWRHWEQVGLTYDSTLTYADHAGFRCGTCHPFRPFDVEQNRELDLLEVPLIVMDGTLRNYRDLTPEEGEARILELAQRCKQVEGTFTLLWHNTSLDGEWRPWREMYQRAVRMLAEWE
jgi:hypothetical protein